MTAYACFAATEGFRSKFSLIPRVLYLRFLNSDKCFLRLPPPPSFFLPHDDDFFPVIIKPSEFVLQQYATYVARNSFNRLAIVRRMMCYYYHSVICLDLFSSSPACRRGRPVRNKLSELGRRSADTPDVSLPTQCTQTSSSDFFELFSAVHEIN